MANYTKPHLPYDQQLQRLVDRGMTYADRGVALRTLKRIGYYRLSAYTYPFRAPLDIEHPDGRKQGRSDNFLAGTSMEAVLALYEFDRKLRNCLRDALEMLELGLAVHVGYVAGKRDPFVHLNRSCLDDDACSLPDRDGNATDTYEGWLDRYRKHQKEAKNEDFVRHFILNYESRLPIWAATEVMSFGSLARLYSLLKPADRKKIAANLGVADGKLLHGWLLSLNVLRNHCAHHGRIWNRVMAYPPGKMQAALVEDELRHLTRVDDGDRGKLYYMAALLSYFVVRIDADTNWPRTFRTLMKKFPNTHGMTPENSMGFQKDWESELLWNYDPKK